MPSNPLSQLSLEVIVTTAAFETLQEAWDTLLAQSAHKEPMQSHLWLGAWWRHFGDGRSLAVGLLREGTRLVGIAPCCTRDFRYPGGLAFRRLELMGAAEGESDSITSEYLGLIAAQGYEQAVASAFADGVAGGAFGSWHECVLEMMNGESALAAMITQDFARHGFAAEQATALEAPYIALPEDWPSYLAGLRSKRRLVANAIRDFETTSGKDGYAIRRATDRASFERGFAILADLHEQRWRAEGQGGAFSRPRFAAFHGEVAAALLDSGRLGLLWLEVGGEPVAAHYLITEGDRVLFYQSGRRMEEQGNVRLGIVMMAFAIKDCIERGAKEFDLLGGKSQYKMTFTRTVRPLVRLRIARPSWRETLRRSLIAVRNRVRGSSRQAPQPSD